MTKITECRFCGSSNLITYLDLGEIPLANNLEETEKKALAASKYPLAVNWCNDCTMSQLTHAVEPSLLFKNYYYRSGMSNTFKKHCQDLVKDINPSKNKFWIDIASNDGTLLSYVNCKKLGVEPATNLCHLAESNGIPSHNAFFGRCTALDILEKHDKADVITAQNVFAHVSDIADFIFGVKQLLKNDGVFIVEAPWVGDFLEENQFDTVYHEHYSYISVGGMRDFCCRNNLRLDKIKYFQGLHGGTIRYFIKHINAPGFDISNDWAISNVIFKESFFIDKVDRMQKAKDTLEGNLKDYLDNHQVHGVGQAAKATIMCNSLGLTIKDIPVIYDTTPEKIGKYQPGTGIEIRDFNFIPCDRKTNLLIFPWNFKNEILSNINNLPEMHSINYITLIPYLMVNNDKA